MKIGLLVIATGSDYHRFIGPLLSSVDRYFIKGHEVAVHLWTDATADFPVKHRFPIKALDWPFPTLYRYHYALQQSDVLAANDHLFLLDVDMLVVDDVDDEVLSDGITATQHPGFAFSGGYLLPYEQNPASRAFVPRQRYFAGAFQGGKTDAFMRLSGAIRDAIDDDLKRNHVACWHDESHYNKFLASAPPTVVLDPAYCYPEDALVGGNAAVREHYLSRWGCDYKPKILALLKPTQQLWKQTQQNAAVAASRPMQRTSLRRLVRDMKTRWR